MTEYKTGQVYRDSDDGTLRRVTSADRHDAWYPNGTVVNEHFNDMLDVDGVERELVYDPPATPEPTGLGAVVRAKGLMCVRIGKATAPWRCRNTKRYYSWEALVAHAGDPEILSEGVEV